MLTFLFPRYILSILVQCFIFLLNFSKHSCASDFIISYPEHEINLTLISPDVTDFFYTRAN